MLSICSPQLGLSPESNSGGEVHDREILTRLCQQNIIVHSLLPRGRSYPSQDNLKINYAWIRSMVPPHVFNAFVFPYLIKTYLTQGFNLLRVHNPYFVGPAAVIFKKLFPQVPLVLTHHHVEKGINHLIDKIFINKFDHIITVSQYTKKQIIDNFLYPSKKISVAYNGINNCFQPGLKSKNLVQKLGLEDKVVLLFLGGLKVRKNPQFLLDVLVAINNPDVCLIFAGTGPLLKRLKIKTIKLGLESQVRFTGFISESEKSQYYQLADILLLPSLEEGFGMTLTEAGACSIPVIGSNNSSIKEIIVSGKTGYLAKTNDIHDWVQKLIQLIKSKTFRQQMGKSAQKHVRNKFSWDKSIKIHLKIFDQLIKNSNLIKQ